MSNSIQSILDHKDLISIPQSLVNILKISNNADVEVDELADALQRDPIVTARMFGFASTIQYRPWKEVQNIKKLIIVIGLDNVRKIIYASVINQIFSKIKNELYDFYYQLWSQSLLCANINEELARIACFEDRHEFYLSGLLHRIGQFALVGYDDRMYRNVASLSAGLVNLEEIERQSCGFTSSEIGAEVVKRWELPSFISDSIQYQTLPFEKINSGADIIRTLNLSQKISSGGVNQIHANLHAINSAFGLTEGLLFQIYNDAYNKTLNMIEEMTGFRENNLVKSFQDSFKASSENLNTLVQQKALVDSVGLKNHQNISYENFLRQIREDLLILFGFDNVCFFVRGMNGQNIYGIDDTGNFTQIKKLKISLVDNNEFYKKHIYPQKITFLEYKDLQKYNILEKQLFDILQADRLLVYPLFCADKCYGLIVIENVNEINDTKLSFIKLVVDSIAQKISNAGADDFKTKEHFELQIRTAVHEMGNPLSIINTYLHILKEKLDVDDEISSQIEMIQNEIQRVGEIAAGLRNINELKDQEVAVDINRLLNHLTNFFEKSIFENKSITCTVNLDEPLPVIQANEDKLKQIVINIIKNAVESFTDSGQLWLTTRDNVISNGTFYIEIEIEDNGPGIDKNIFETIFHPHVSTKNGHSGLGLSVVKSLVADIKGDIRCATGRKGSRFQILIPREVAQDNLGRIDE
ncbi:HDOD domain-containing protein [Desulfohalobium retbaense]|uniref:histidine kinase n=1 Tax=Desulfohalobium retbaense (strain ATCC 49708 / DSM 5692 / JCM 16813 / HR100) TaxID=485915 RepID=C8X1Q1_DESRD|nr:HDOD domain-containing protein [Desulfohalobium retbaense]ACV68473.1 signal transduction histidine kinase, nitrogen specific, NtrB [Desulfohalobium retbaense DSM 5692]